MRTKVTKMFTTEMSNNAFRDGMVGVNSLLSAAGKSVELITIAPVFAQVLKDYTEALDKVTDSAAETKILQETDKDFVSCWQRQKKYLQGLKTSFEDSEVTKASEIVYAIMNSDGSILGTTLEDRYGKAQKIINRLAELDEKVLQNAKSDAWFAQIKQKFAAVKTAKDNRDNAKAAIIIGCRACARAQLELAYTFVIKYLNFKIQFDNSQAIQELVAQMNVAAKDINAKILARKSAQNADTIVEQINTEINA